MSVLSTLKAIKPAFWLANAQEACERLAYFGIRAILPLMMVSVGTGGLGLSMAEKGAIYGVWALIQCLVPMVSGGFSESFGYKKSLIIAFCINTLGYLLMANILNVATLLTGSDILNTTANFWLMMIAGCTIGLGTAIFKPPVQGIVAKSLDKSTSGFGFGLFYWVVNIGGFLAPMLATSLRGNDANPTWSYVFYGAAFVTLFNLVITLLFFREPEKIESKEENPHEEKLSAGRVFIQTLKTLWDDKQILLFLLIVSGFWLMFMQLWDLLPNFLDEWTDRRGIGEFLRAIPGIGALDWFESNGALKPEMIINIDSAAIILFVLPLSALFSRYKMMTALILGMVISVVGFIMSGMTMSGGLACLAIFIFAIGEIICSPKFSEYIGMTAPDDKKAIYMGFSNIPFAIGWAVGNFLSGPLYDIFSSKLRIGREWLLANGVSSVPVANLDIANARAFLTEKLNVTADQLPELIRTSGKDFSQLSELLSQHDLSLSDACTQKLADGTLSNLESCQIAEAKSLLSQQDLANLMDVIQSKNITEVPIDYCNIDCVMNQVQATAHVSDAFAATETLWNASSPWLVWIVLGTIGVASMVGMIAFYFKSGMDKKDNLQASDKKSEETAESIQNEEEVSKEEEKTE